MRQDLDELLTGLEVYAQAHAQTPLAALRERVLGQVLAQISAPAVVATAVPAVATAVPAMRVSASNPANAQPVAVAPASARLSGWAIAASVALLLSLAANALFYSRWQQADTALAAVQTSFAQARQASQVQERRYAASQQQVAVLRSPHLPPGGTGGHSGPTPRPTPGCSLMPPATASTSMCSSFRPCPPTSATSFGP